MQICIPIAVSCPMLFHVLVLYRSPNFSYWPALMRRPLLKLLVPFILFHKLSSTLFFYLYLTFLYLCYGLIFFCLLISGKLCFSYLVVLSYLSWYGCIVSLVDWVFLSVSLIFSFISFLDFIFPSSSRSLSFAFPVMAVTLMWLTFTSFSIIMFFRLSVFFLHDFSTHTFFLH